MAWFTTVMVLRGMLMLFNGWFKKYFFALVERASPILMSGFLGAGLMFYNVTSLNVDVKSPSVVIGILTSSSFPFSSYILITYLPAL